MKKILLLLILTLSSLLLISCSGEEAECRHLNINVTVVEPSCSEEGYSQNICADCSFSFRSDIVAPLGHTLTENVTEPSCEEIGYTEYTCACGFSYKSDFVSPLSHTLVPLKVEPTCTAAGYTRYSCDCGYSYDSDSVAPTGHIFSSEKHLPSCTELGYTEYFCSACDASYTADYVMPLGHKFTKTLSRPTYLATGFTRYACGCGFEYVGDYVMSSEIYKGAYLEADAPLAFGVDVSKWNGKVDFSELASLGIDFVILKAGSSKSGVDPAFEENYKAARAAGLDVGAYYYTYAKTVAESLKDAESCSDMLAGKTFEYPIYFDLEDETLEGLGKELLTDITEAFIGNMQSMGWFCGIYINHDWLINRLESERIVTYFDVWYARWTLSGEPNWLDSFGQKTGLWQYTDSGRLGSHECNFDMNVAYRDYPTIMKKYRLNGF